MAMTLRLRGTQATGQRVRTGCVPRPGPKGRRTVESLLRNRPLVDGNKRLGWPALMVFLDINGVRVDMDDDEAYAFVISVASEQLDLSSIAAVITGWIDERS